MSAFVLHTVLSKSMDPVESVFSELFLSANAEQGLLCANEVSPKFRTSGLSRLIDVINYEAQLGLTTSATVVRLRLLEQNGQVREKLLGKRQIADRQFDNQGNSQLILELG